MLFHLFLTKDKITSAFQSVKHVNNMVCESIEPRELVIDARHLGDDDQEGKQRHRNTRRSDLGEGGDKGEGESEGEGEGADAGAGAMKVARRLRASLCDQSKRTSSSTM